MSRTIALLGQPNSGKSTIFNGLTGAHQHVGNWPGKTVERKEGSFRYQENDNRIIDLPGSYSLSAGSDEERITSDFIRSGAADLVAILVDSSQLERSLYMYTDYIGTKTPAILILNLMDVAEKKGINIDTEKLSERIGIPVMSFVASETKKYGALKEQLAKAIDAGKTADFAGLMKYYEQDPELSFATMVDGQKEEKLLTAGKLAVCELEKTDRGLMISGRHKYEYIDELLDGVVKKPDKEIGLSGFDKKALGRHSGKWLAIGIIVAALSVAMLVAAPIMGLGFGFAGVISAPLEKLMASMNVWQPLAELIYVVLPNVLAFTISMAGFVLGVSFAFAIIEDVGYMARISVVFNSAMEKLGLQGKSICSLLMSMGCNMAGVAGSRVIDNSGQRFLTMILVWSIPCGSTLSLAPMLATVFYGPAGAMAVVLIMLLTTVGSLFLVSRIFRGKLISEQDKGGIVMELPPYHKPKWGHIIRETLMKAWDVFSRAFCVITLVSIVFYLLSYNWFGGEYSILSKIGQVIEPVTSWFGMTWQMFMAYISSMITKESLLGVINALYSNTDMVNAAFNAKSIGMTESMMALLPQVITKAQAFGFIMAIVFNVPCTMTVAATFRENHSKKWVALSVVYYLVFSLVLAFVFYHIGLLIWH